MSLFFWRRKKPAQPAAPPPAKVFARPSLAVVTPLLPVQRMVHALALRNPEAAKPIRLNPEQTQLLIAASSEFARVGTEPRYTPQRPSLMPQLMEAVHDEEASLRTLARIVAQDPQLTGELLRTANSALYRVSTAPVESVERAAALLGTSGLRTLIAGALVKPFMQGGSLGQFGEFVWEHSLYGASAAEAWAARNQDSDPFAAHLVALLYGLGSVTVYRVLADLYAAQQQQPDTLTIASALDTSATVTAGRIAGNWGLSDRTREALEAQSSAAPTGENAPLARALRFGLLAGGLVLLIRQGKVKEEDAAGQIAVAGFAGPVADRIWDRLLRAYVHP